jgi:hypothetical protein
MVAFDYFCLAPLKYSCNELICGAVYQLCSFAIRKSLALCFMHHPVPQSERLMHTPRRPPHVRIPSSRATMYDDRRYPALVEVGRQSDSSPWTPVAPSTGPISGSPGSPARKSALGMMSG